MVLDSFELRVGSRSVVSEARRDMPPCIGGLFSLTLQRQSRRPGDEMKQLMPTIYLPGRRTPGYSSRHSAAAPRPI